MKIILEVPESTYLVDFNYYWKNGNDSIKACGIFDENYLVDGNTINACSDRFVSTRRKKVDYGKDNERT